MTGAKFGANVLDEFMRVASLFAGIGGFDLALERQGHEIVYANDFDSYCKITYDKHFKVKLDVRSITEVSSSEIPDHDLLVGGFPCQAFSIAGRRGGFEDTRGTLFFDIARILKDKRPSYLLLENVKGLLSHDNGRTFETIMRTLDELGYDTQWQVLNSKNFGVPQNRERVFIIGHIRGISRPEIFPIRGDVTKDQRKLGLDVSFAIDASYYKGINTGSQGGRSSFEKMKRQVIVTGDLTGEKWDRFHESSRRVYNTQGLAPTLPTSAGGGHTPKIVDNLKIRRLTPLEGERLQGFPNGWTEGVSDTQRYKQLGNAVTVNVVEEIIKRFDLNLVS